MTHSRENCEEFNEEDWETNVLLPQSGSQTAERQSTKIKIPTTEQIHFWNAESFLSADWSTRAISCLKDESRRLRNQNCDATEIRRNEKKSRQNILTTRHLNGSVMDLGGARLGFGEQIKTDALYLIFCFGDLDEIAMCGSMIFLTDLY